MKSRRQVRRISDKRHLALQKSSLFELLEARHMMSAVFHNDDNPLDVNGDSHVSPLDALLVINELNAESRNAEVNTTTATSDEPRVYLDVNLDDNVSPIDALLVINHLNLANEEYKPAEGTESEGVTTPGSSSSQSSSTDTLLLGPENRVNTTTKYLQRSPAVAITPNGYVVVWEGDFQDGSGMGIIGQRHDTSGNRQGGEFIVNRTTRGSQRAPQVAAFSDGRFVAVWESDNQDGSGIGVFARLFGADGNPLSSDIQVNQTTSGTQRAPAVAVLANGDFVVGWEGKNTTDSRRNDTYGVHVRVFSSTGVGLTNEFRVNDQGSGQQENIALVDHPNGGFVAVWQGDSRDDNDGISLRRFDARGLSLGTEVTVNSFRRGDQRQPAVDTAADGTIVVTWASGSEDKSGWSVHAQQLSADGRLLGDSIRINQKTTGTQWRPDVAFLSDGSYVVSWEGYGIGDYDGVHASHVQRDAVTAGEQFIVSKTTKGHQANLQLAASAMGIIAAWDGMGTGDSLGVFSRSIGFARPNSPPTLAAIADQSVDELQALAIQAAATDPDGDLLAYSLDANSLALGMTVDKNSGRIDWVPTELQGPGDYPVTLKVVQVDKPSFSAERAFVVRVREVNQPPQLTDQPSREAISGQTLNIPLVGTDPDVPANTLTYSLVGETHGATINPVTGVFTWIVPQNQPAGDRSFTVRVADNGQPSLFDETALVVSVSNPTLCLFDSRLSGWTVRESGGTQLAKGTVVAADCEAVLTEGDSFVTELKRSFVMPAGLESISLTYDQLAFDATEPNFVNDAFEVALVDQDGFSLVPTIGVGRDAFFNVTEGLAPTPNSLLQDGNRIVLNTATVPEGSRATLIIRLVNNDSDVRSSVHITDVTLPNGPLTLRSVPGTSPPLVQVNGLASAQLTHQHLAATVAAAQSSLGRIQSAANPPLDANAAVAPNLQLTAAGLERGLKVSTFISNIQPYQIAGPLGIAFPSSGGVIVANYNGNILFFQSTEDGQVGSDGVVAANFGATNPHDLARVNNRIYLSTENNGGSVYLLSNTGVPETRLVDGLTYVYGLAGNPVADANGVHHLFVASDSGVWDINPVTREKKLSIPIRFDGISTDGTILFGADLWNNRILGVSLDTKSVIYNFPVPGGPDGTALGTGGLSGHLYVNTNTEGVWEIDVKTGAKTQIATGQDSRLSRGDFVAVAPDGSLLITQTAEINRIIPPSGGGFGNSNVIVSAATERSHVPVGTSLVLHGLAQSVLSSTGANVPIAHVTVNGVPADVLDAAGRFFAKTTIELGDNRFTIQATDIEGKTGATSLKIIGQDAGGIDFSRFTDITGSFGPVYQYTSFNDLSNVLHVDLATRNDGTFDVQVPLLVGVKNISDPNVAVLNPDGVTPAGVPYFDFSKHVTNRRLAPGQQTASPTIQFLNVAEQRFDYELVFYGETNQSPAFTSVPVIEALAGKPYVYDADAQDPDGDIVEFSLPSANFGANRPAFDPTSGLLTWTPTVEDVGNHEIIVQATDGRGGVAEQRYVLSVIPAPPNRPPVIVSQPEISVQLGDTLDSAGGYVFVTGHDSLWHSAKGQGNAEGAKKLSRRAIDFVRHGSQLPFLFVESTKVPLVSNNIHEASTLTTVLGYTEDDFVVADANDLAALTSFKDELTKYSALIVASDHGGMLTAAELAFLNSHSADIISYVNSGGGLAAFAEGNEVGLIGNTPRFAFLPFIGSSTDFTTPESHNTVAEFGQVLGFQTDEVNGNFSHNFFTNTGNLLPVDLLNGDSSRPLSLAYRGILTSDGAVNPNYTYQVVARDADADPLTYRLDVFPPGMNIDSATGLITWTPTSEQTGKHSVSVKVSDGRGGEATQDFTVCVTPPTGNASPAFVSNPTVVVTSGNTYKYRAEAIDPDDTDLTYSLVDGPPNLSINAVNGLVSWDTNGVAAGTHNVAIQVRDRKGGSDQQNYRLTVLAAGTNEINGIVFWDVNGSGAPSESVPIGENLIINGSFDDGRPEAINSDYIRTRNGNSNEGTYWVSGTDPGGNWPGGAWGPPRAEGNIGRLNVNGDDSGNFSTKRVWYQTVNVEAGTAYEFSAWAWATHSGPDGYQLRFSINGQQLGSVLEATSARLWEPFKSIYVATESGPVEISIVNVSGRTLPNDFMLDDFEFYEIQQSANSLGNWVVYLDQNQNRKREPDELSTITDAVGNYAFTDLPSGKYYVREETQLGWKQTYPVQSTSTDAHVVTVTGRQIAAGRDFGNVKTTSDGNTNPEFDELSVSGVSVNQLLRVQATARDADSDTLSFELVAGPAGLTIHPSSGTIVWKPIEAQQGEHSVVLRVIDGRGGVDVQSINIAVNVPNSAPEFSTELPSLAVVGQPLTYQVRAQDADGDPLTVTLADNSVGALTNEILRDAAGNIIGTQYRLSWTPTQEDLNAGTRQITIVASDGKNATRQTTDVSVVASAPNQRPTLAPIARTVARPGIPYIYQLAADDPDSDPLTFNVSGQPSGMTVSSTGLLTWVVPADASDASAIQVAVSDGRGGVNNQTFTLSIASIDANSAPSIISNPRRAARNERLYEYDPVGEDAEGDPLTWSLDTAPVGMSIDRDSGAIRWRPRTEQLGSYDVTVRATDTFGATAVQSFSIDVRCVNSTPLILSTPPTQASVGDLYLYGVRATDEDDDLLAVSLEGNLPGMRMESGILRWTPTTSDAGTTRTVVIKVTDPDGAVALQSYKIEVTAATNLNRPPVITSTPDFASTTNEPYTYRVQGTDPDGDTLNFRLATEYAGMAIDATTGVLTWNPTVAGTYPIVIEATDAEGATATQGYALEVRDNAAPTIDSVSVNEATSGGTYRYSVRATDPDGDALTYSLEGNPPSGLTIDALGRIVWQVPIDFASNAPKGAAFSVVVKDTHGASATQSVPLIVSPDTAPPTVRIAVLTGSLAGNGDINVDLGSTVHLQVSAVDNVGVSGVSLTANGVMVPLDASGRATISNAVLGTLQLAAIARDAAGNSGNASATVHIVNSASKDSNRPNPNPGDIDPSDTGVPVVRLTRFVNLQGEDIKQFTATDVSATVTESTAIYGTIDDPENRLWYYDVYFARADLVDTTNIDLRDPDFVNIGHGTQEVINGKIADFDPTALSRDSYAIVLAGFDKNGQGYIHYAFANVEGNLQLGNFHLDFTDLSIPLAGIPIQITRSYDTTLANTEGDFGYGWTFGTQDPRILETVPAGANFVRDQTKVYLTNPDGQRVGFTFTYDVTDCQGSFFGGICQPRFRPDPGVYDRLETTGTVGVGGIVEALAGPFNPDSYKLTTKDGVEYDYNQQNGLRRITDLNRNFVEFTDTAIKHSSGAQIAITRDGRGRVASIQDPSGKSLRYEYSASGDLIRYTDQAGVFTTYDYRVSPQHFLDSATDSLGRSVLTVVYENGVYKHVVDGAGNKIGVQTLDALNRIATVRDGNDNETKLLYDERGNITEETDALGKTIYREYKDPANPDKETKVTDREGHVTTYRYDSRGNTTQIVDAIGTRTFTYNSQNKPTSQVDEKENKTSFQYDSAGNLQEIVNALGDKSTVQYDSQGRPTAFTDFRGFITRFEYKDSSTQPSRILNPDDVPTDSARRSVRTLEYNKFGQTVRAVDEEGIVTITEYDDAGRVKREQTGADAPVEYRYQGSLQIERIVRRSTVEPGSTDIITQFGYWPTDKLRYEIDALGGVTGYEYDGNGNRTFLGRWDSFTDYNADYDLAKTNPAVRAGRYPKATFEHVFVYDEVNRVDYEVDDVQLDLAEKAGLSLDQVTVRLDYKYDANGNRNKIIDRNGRVRTFEYDARGRMESEQWFADANDTTPDRSFVWSYCSCGAIEEATEYAAAPGTSEILSHYIYTHDRLNRMTSVDNINTKDMPRVVLSYDYDKNGNRISVSDNLGVAVKSTYDSRNRLDLRWWENTTAAHEVDEVLVDFNYYRNGREKELVRYTGRQVNEANRVGHTLHGDMDASGRTRTITHVSRQNAVDTVLARYVYGFDKLGLVDSLDYDNATLDLNGVADPYDFFVDYKYDELGQLTDADYSNTTTSRGIYIDEYYRYDKNGNRTDSYLHPKSAQSDGMSYETGRGNRLLSDGEFAYRYDNEGNMIRKIQLVNGQATGETTVFTYDHRNHMTRATVYSKPPEEGGVIIRESTNRYDIDSRRIAFAGDDDGLAAVSSQETHVIQNQDESWADFTVTNEVKSRYFFGKAIDNLAAAFNPLGGTLWYLVDLSNSGLDISKSTENFKHVASYSVYGSDLYQSSLGMPIRFGYTGREFDVVSSMYYFRERFYHPATGRFTGLDPLGFDVSGPTANLYGYVFNSPLNGRDPDGRAVIGEYGLGLGLALGVLGGAASANVYALCNGLNGNGDQVTVTGIAKASGIGFVFGFAIGTGILQSLLLSASELVPVLSRILPQFIWRYSGPPVHQMVVGQLTRPIQWTGCAISSFDKLPSF